jgi:hypothetical protein
MPEINIPKDSLFFENFNNFIQLLYAHCVLVLKLLSWEDILGEETLVDVWSLQMVQLGKC